MGIEAPLSEPLAQSLAQGIKKALTSDFAETRVLIDYSADGKKAMKRFIVMEGSEKTGGDIPNGSSYIVIAELCGYNAKFNEGDDTSEIGGYDQEGNYTPSQEVPNYSVSSNTTDYVHVILIDRKTGSYVLANIQQSNVGAPSATLSQGGVVLSENPSRTLIGAFGYTFGASVETPAREALSRISNVLNTGLVSLDLTRKLVEFTETTPEWSAEKVSPSLIIENIPYLNSILTKMLTATPQFLQFS